MREFDKILEHGEEVLWEGTPKFGPFVAMGIVGSIIFGFFGAMFGLPILIALLVGGSLLGGALTGAALALLALFFGGLLVLSPVIYQAVVHRYMRYAITNRRVIIQKGIIGRDFQIVDFDKISNAEVNVGVLDKLFGGNSGSIHLHAGRMASSGKHGMREVPETLQHVLNPYEVFKFFKKTSFDVKTDMEYPNKMRPGENPGYGTKYRPRKK